MSERDFYVGYEPQAPPGLSRFLRRVVVGLLLGGVGIAALLASLQQPFDPGIFEFGVVREFEGLMLTDPVPALIVDEPLEGMPPEAASRFLLVAPGKFGAADLVSGMDGRRVEVRGSLIYRGRLTMIELLPGSMGLLAGGASPEPEIAVDLGEHTLMGEIVDSKCYLGVMKPGRRKTHRACAARCISGGVPPILRVDVVDAEPLHLLLVGRDGGAINRAILEYVAEPVAVSGRVWRHGAQLVVHADPNAICRRYTSADCG